MPRRCTAAIAGASRHLASHAHRSDRTRIGMHDQPQMIRLISIPYFMAIYVVGVSFWVTGLILRAHPRLSDIGLMILIALTGWYFLSPLYVE